MQAAYPTLVAPALRGEYQLFDQSQVGADGTARHWQSEYLPHRSGDQVMGFYALLAEDNAVNQKLATPLLQGLGAEVHVAVNGVEVLQALRESNFDAVLMDCQMPQMDRYEATGKYAVLKDGREIPISP